MDIGDPFDFPQKLPAATTTSNHPQPTANTKTPPIVHNLITKEKIMKIEFYGVKIPTNTQLKTGARLFRLVAFLVIFLWFVRIISL